MKASAYQGLPTVTTADKPQLDPMTVVRDLCALPHRGATTANEYEAADRLERHLRSLGADVRRQRFKTARTYVSEIWWMICALVLGLLLLPVLTHVGAVWVTCWVALALHYFDWRASPVAWLPLRRFSQNVIGSHPSVQEGTHHLILMAHYDSAPVSLLYLPSMVKNFRSSLLTSLALMLVAAVVAWLYALGVGLPWVDWARYLLAGYFLLQGFVASFDYWRLGFTNGAADNATGAGVAVATAARLWAKPPAGWKVDVVLTGAEETNLKGARAFYNEWVGTADKRRTFLFNFDNLGAGAATIVTETGSLTSIVYANALIEAAVHVAANDARFSDIQKGPWHTGDFDSSWFARAGIPAMTLSARDEHGLIPNLHRPSDTLSNVIEALPRHAVDFAESVVRRLATVTQGPPPK